MANVPFTSALRAEYDQLFALAEIRPTQRFAVQAVVDTIRKPANWARYMAIQGRTGIPAHVVGIIHSMEASCRFDRHLHNGDPLTARTIQVPKGRPKAGAPPFGWEDSAVDALGEFRDLKSWTDWSVAGVAYVLERYNGFGYRRFHPHVKSPYLWSFTTIYSAGKYVADGQWSEEAVSKQCGGLAILKALVQAGDVQLGGAPARAPAAEPAVSTTTAAAIPPYPGRPLRKEMEGPAVQALQARLVALGIATAASVDGDFGERTEWAVRQFQARTEDETGEPLEIDGVVGPRTWRALFGGADATLATRPTGGLNAAVLAAAAGEVGVCERPAGSNRGPRVDQYSATVGIQGQPWCAAFVHWCFREASEALGVANPHPVTGSVWRSWEKAVASRPAPTVVTAAEARAAPELVKPGMVFYIDTGGRTGHTGLVADIVNGRLVTIEGNTNDGGSREGIGVFSRSQRRISQINLGFVDFG